MYSCIARMNDMKMQNHNARVVFYGACIIKFANLHDIEACRITAAAKNHAVGLYKGKLINTAQVSFSRV